MWKALITTFLLVFVCELGDKTQLAVMLLAGEDKSPTAVFLGAASALVLSSFIAVWAGTWIANIVPQNYLRLGAGTMFMIMGVLILWGKL